MKNLPLTQPVGLAMAWAEGCASLAQEKPSDLLETT